MITTSLRIKKIKNDYNFKLKLPHKINANTHLKNFSRTNKPLFYKFECKSLHSSQQIS